MSIDARKYNEVFNKLKELAGERGGFVLFLNYIGDGHEDMKFETHGSITTVTGLLHIGSQAIGERIEEKVAGILTPAPRQPD